MGTTPSLNGTPRACYRLYGLTVSSSLRLPRLHRIELDRDAPDVQIHLQEMPAELSGLSEDAGELWWTSWLKYEDGRPLRTIRSLNGGDFYHLLFEEGMRFVLDRRCRHVWATFPAEHPIEDLALCMMGPVFGTLMRIRGMVCLHASAVQLGSYAVCFVGSPGAGKSTTAAAFAHCGYPVLSDDVVTLDPSPAGYLVHHGYPHLRLCPDVAVALYQREDALPVLDETWEKRRLDLDGSGTFCTDPVPLRAVYLLGERTVDARIQFRTLEPREALLALVTNTYANSVLDGNLRKAEFAFLSNFLQRVPVRTVSPPRDLDSLPLLCRAIVNDVEELPLPAADAVQADASQAAATV